MDKDLVHKMNCYINKHDLKFLDIIQLQDGP